MDDRERIARLRPLLHLVDLPAPALERLQLDGIERRDVLLVDPQGPPHLG